MNDSPRLTAEQFAESKFDLPEGGRWSELVAGEIVSLQPPDVAHGNAVLNLSKTLAEYLETAEEGYACFELGLVVARNPDTVRCPAVSCFTAGNRFEEADKIVTETKPGLVVEMASTNDRRHQMQQRVESYLLWGVRMVWVADPNSRELHIFQPDQPHRRLADHQSALGNPVLRGFRLPVAQLFAEPDWWTV